MTARVPPRYVVPALVLAASGAGACVVALCGFVLTVATNRLPWHPGLSVQEHYQEMGRSYSQGFAVGFFLCFFLTLAGIIVSSWWERRRERTASRVAQPDLAS
jgi:uncharacterized membrane protein YecN with MAPEG domain